MRRLGLLKRREDGTYAQAKRGVIVDDPSAPPSVRAFHTRILKHAKDAVVGMVRRERDVSSLSLSVSASTYDAVVEEIQALKDRIEVLVHGDHESLQAYQFNLELFPVSPFQEARHAGRARAWRLPQGRVLRSRTQPDH